MFGCGLAQRDHIAEFLHDGDDLFFREPARRLWCLGRGRLMPFLGLPPLGSGLGDPARDHGRVRARVERRPVAVRGASSRIGRGGSTPTGQYRASKGDGQPRR